MRHHLQQKQKRHRGCIMRDTHSDPPKTTEVAVDVVGSEACVGKAALAVLLENMVPLMDT
jgi:hypothetical protein